MEKDKVFSKAALVIDYVFWVLAAIILLRFAFKLIGAASQNTLVGVVYGLTNPTIDLFRGIAQDITSGSAVIEFSSLVSIVILWLIYKAALRLVTIVR